MNTNNTLKKQYISNDSLCKGNYIQKYNIINFLRRNEKGFGESLHKCNETGIILSSITFLNHILYYTFIITFLIIIITAIVDYITILGRTHKSHMVSLRKKTFRKNIETLPYEIKQNGKLYYVCADTKQSWDKNWFKNKKEFINPNLITNLALKSKILENINCNTFVEKNVSCKVDQDENKESANLSNQIFYRKVPLDDIDFSSHQTEKCSKEPAIRLNEINYKKKLYRKDDVNNDESSHIVSNLKVFYLLFFLVFFWFLLLQLVFSNYNYALEHNDNWLYVVLQMYGLLFPIISFIIFFFKSDIIYSLVDSYFGTDYYMKWKNKNRVPHLVKLRNIVSFSSFICLYSLILLFIITNKENSTIKLIKLLKFYNIYS